MLDTFLAVLGIFVSLGLFLVGYRQTVGAKKERISACNSEAEKILLRRIVLEAYAPTILDVERLIEGKARDFRVHSDELLSAAQLLNTLHTRIVKSDLIPAEQRREILGRINPAVLESEAKSVEEIESSVAQKRQLLSATTAAVALLAVLASAAGALISLLPELANLDTTYPGLVKTFSFTAVASFAVISLFAAASRLRASQEDVPTKGNEVEEYVRFEGAVASALRKLGLSVRATPPGQRGGGDFMVEHGGRKYIIEVKSWPRRVPTRVLAHLAERLTRTAQEFGADEVLIVTPHPLLDVAESLQIPGVQFLTLKQLPMYLKRRGSSDAA